MTAAADGVFARLAKTRRTLAGLLGGGRVDAAKLDDLHDQLILADVGVGASGRIIERLRQTARDGGEMSGVLRRALVDILRHSERPLVVSAAPFVVLMVGVNGAGKTTTLAKLAAHLQPDHSVMLAACDTHRAAAIEQLQAWGRRLRLPVIAQTHGADAAAVAYDAYRQACAKRVQVLLVDTAGRLHTDTDLMAQLLKIKRVLQKAAGGDGGGGRGGVSGVGVDGGVGDGGVGDGGVGGNSTDVTNGNSDTPAPHETLLIVDANTGHNAISQTASFHAAIGLTGIIVTKLDGTARGGVVVALAERFALPIRYLGIGTAADDLRPFNAAEFAAALLPPTPTSVANPPTAPEK